MIVIQDMKMPNTCTMCWLSNICKVRHGKPSWNGWQNRMNGCPLVEIVQCKDCKHFKNHTGKFREQRFRKDGICKYHNYEQVMLDGFCSNAERGNDDRRNKTETD